jgi:peptidoglycan/xylan/chitin deacetylase (PgdA/CDA1 family)
MRNKNVRIIRLLINHRQFFADMHERHDTNKKMGKKFLLSIPFLLVFLPLVAFADGGSPGSEKGIPILVYHRFGPQVADSMTVTDAVFEAHLKYLQENGFKVVPLKELVEKYLAKGLLPNFRAVALTADDGHISIYTDALPLLKKYRVPVTFFIYPSAISNASYAMTWDQLRQLESTGLFDFESHTYWHPNFKKDRQRLKPAEYEKSVEIQLKKSKEILEKQLNQKVNMLAWPFGIYDPRLESKAAEAGYMAAFSIDRHQATPSKKRMTFPRYLMTNADRGKAFERIVGGFSPSNN